MCMCTYEWVLLVTVVMETEEECEKSDFLHCVCMCVFLFFLFFNSPEKGYYVFLFVSTKTDFYNSIIWTQNSSDWILQRRETMVNSPWQYCQTSGEKFFFCFRFFCMGKWTQFRPMRLETMFCYWWTTGSLFFQTIQNNQVGIKQDGVLDAFHRVHKW